MKILTVVGARPQFIKASVLSAELARQGCREFLVHTGQHYDDNMSKVFFDGLKLREPDRYLGVGSASHALQTAEIMTRLEPVLASISPDCVLVYGDTNSTLAGALVASKLQIPIGHVEAGLRSFNRQMPEEINRLVVDHIATQHFAPTQTAVDNLLHEGIKSDLHLVGDLMVDLVNATVQSLPKHPRILQRFNLTSHAYGVATVHRAANTDDPEAFRAILKGLRGLDFPIVFPVHPRTLPLFQAEAASPSGNIITCEPLNYSDMIALEAHAKVILTDSGGIQKEALTLAVPCVTLRRETEWVETLENGWNVLSGTDPDLISRYATRPKPTAESRRHYGEGTTAKQIANILIVGHRLKEAIA